MKVSALGYDNNGEWWKFLKIEDLKYLSFSSSKSPLQSGNVRYLLQGIQNVFIEMSQFFFLHC